MLVERLHVADVVVGANFTFGHRAAGDVAMLSNEVTPVLKALRANGLNVVAIHHHMSGENPRLLFLHYWGRGKAVDLAKTVKKGLDLTAWDGKAKGA